MLTPQFLLPIASELVVDLFAGGGGASTGIEQAIGRPVDIAVNHDPEAVSLHTANHPQTQHFICDVFEVDPLQVTAGQAVGLLWASPDCKHFSKAKGGKPVSKKIRGLAWVVVEWVRRLAEFDAGKKPRVICLENVEEFQTWGPLGDDDRPCPLRKGETFNEWLAALRSFGYVVEWRELRASDYGTPTIRKRLFLVARCDGQPIVWPEPTHGKPGTLPVKAKKLQPWRTAAECIDWSIPCPSIFERKRPLADATLRRVAKGVMRYVVDAAEPFIVGLAHGAHAGRPDAGDRSHGVDEPVRTIHAGGGNHALVIPTLVQTGYGERPGQAPRVPGLEKPLGTAVAGQKHALVAAFLAKHYTGVVGSEAAEPIGTVTSVDHHSLVAAHLVHMGHGEGKDGKKRFSHGIRDVREPLNTVTANGMPAGVVTSQLVKLRGTSTAQAANEPLHTISAQGQHFAEVRAFLLKYYGTDQDPQLSEPLHTVTTKDRFALVTVRGEQYAIVDIGLRMLTPRELYRAQGFPDSYRIEQGAAGEPLTKTAQVRMCGNSVCPRLARAIVAANYRDLSMERAVA
ncbi:DNA (cytosine-5)-methyltransferase 1 [Pseudacidovorax sp. 1753]|uniref:DNA cytosine methyltransferase n=1 Tax=Pseudacidovorax sp. 1753 TaxID=3156419 RepID=UPI00339B8193